MVVVKARNIRGMVSLSTLLVFFIATVTVGTPTVISSSISSSNLNSPTGIPFPKFSQERNENMDSELRMTSSNQINLDPTEYSRLKTLYDELNGPEWAWETGDYLTGPAWNFSDGTDPCVNRWQGVFCTDNCNGTCGVYTLNLTAHHLVGTLPEHFFNFSYMNFLYLSDNHIHGQLPEILNMPQLSLLNISYNNFNGSIPESYGTHLGSSLQLLYLSNNQLGGSLPRTLTRMSRLKYLYLLNNAFTGTIPTSLGNMSQLLFLNLGVNHFQGSLPNSLRALSHLEVLYMNNNSLSGPFPAMLPPSLTKISFECNQLTGQLPDAMMGKFQNLSVLKVNDNHFTGTIPKSLSTLKNLETLQLHKNKFTGSVEYIFDATVQKSLANIDVSNNALSGAFPASVFLLPQLSVMAAVKNCFSGTLPSTICGAKALSVVSLDGLTSSHECVEYLWDPLNLDLTAGYFAKSMQGTIPDCVWSLPNLTTLHLSGNSFTGPLQSSSSSYLHSVATAVHAGDNIYRDMTTGSASRGGLGVYISSSLKDVSLSHNKLTGSIPEDILRFPFETLDLSYNRFTGNVGALKDATLRNRSSSGGGGGDGGSDDGEGEIVSGTALTLEENRLSGNIPSSLENAYDVNILRGNVFSCSDQDPLPRHDPAYTNYICGSDELDRSMVAFAVLLGALLLLTSSAAVALHRSAVCVHMNRIYGVAKYVRHYVSAIGIQLDGRFPPHHRSQPATNKYVHYLRFSSSLILLRRLFVCIAAYIVLICLPVYLFFYLYQSPADSSSSNSEESGDASSTGSTYRYSTHSNRYSWISTTVFLTGNAPAITLFVLWSLASVWAVLKVLWYFRAFHYSHSPVVVSRSICSALMRMLHPGHERLGVSTRDDDDIDDDNDDGDDGDNNDVDGSDGRPCPSPPRPHSRPAPSNIRNSNSNSGSISSSIPQSPPRTPPRSSWSQNKKSHRQQHHQYRQQQQEEEEIDRSMHRASVSPFRSSDATLLLTSTGPTTKANLCRDRSGCKVANKKGRQCDASSRMFGDDGVDDDNNSEIATWSGEEGSDGRPSGVSYSSSSQYLLPSQVSFSSSSVCTPAADGVSHCGDGGGGGGPLSFSHHASEAFKHTKREVVGFLPLSALFCLNTAATIAVNILYVKVLNASDISSYLKIGIQVLMAGFKLLWNVVVIRKLISHVPFDRGSIRLHASMLITNTLLVPCFASAVTDSACFNDLIFGSNSISASYTYSSCVEAYQQYVESEGSIQTVCSHCINTEYTTEYTPSFSYSFTCGSALLKAYIPVYIYTYTMLALLLPLVFVFNMFTPSRLIPAWLMPQIDGIMRPQNVSRSSGSPFVSFRHLLKTRSVQALTVQHLVMLLTFGITSPVLATVIAIAVITHTYALQAILLRYIEFETPTSAMYGLVVRDRSNDKSNGDADPGATVGLLDDTGMKPGTYAYDEDHEETGQQQQQQQQQQHRHHAQLPEQSPPRDTGTTAADIIASNQNTSSIAATRTIASSSSSGSANSSAIFQEARLRDLDFVCGDTWTSLRHTIWLVFYCSTVFYAALMFDVIGDTSGLQAAVSVPITALAVLIVVRFGAKPLLAEIQACQGGSGGGGDADASTHGNNGNAGINSRFYYDGFDYTPLPSSSAATGGCGTGSMCGGGEGAAGNERRSSSEESQFLNANNHNNCRDISAVVSTSLLLDTTGASTATAFEDFLESSDPTTTRINSNEDNYKCQSDNHNTLHSPLIQQQDRY